MSELYRRIDEICKARGTNVTAICKQAGVGRATLSELKAGRTKALSVETAQKIANTLGVSLNFLLGDFSSDEPISVTVSIDELKEFVEKKAPAPESGRKISEAEIKAAFFEGANVPPEEMDALWADAKDYIQFKLKQRGK